MNKGKVVRLAGFVGALGLSTVLVTTAIQGTGAYFTDSTTGTVTGTAGHLSLETVVNGTWSTDETPHTLNFTGLMPGGTPDSQDIRFRVDTSSGNSDVWLVFNKDDEGYLAFSGPDGLGGYGHFKVASSQGFGFESYNLHMASDVTNWAGPYFQKNAQGTCEVYSNGTGGSTAQAVGPDNATQSAPECGVPIAIQIGDNLAANEEASVAITFGLTGKASSLQDNIWASVPFEIVATQAGHRPDALNY